jgi:hypothetical protein
MIWQALFSALLKPIIHALSLAASWFGGRKSAQADINAVRLKSIRDAKEVENEVEALDRESLKSRARKWVRGPKR